MSYTLRLGPDGGIPSSTFSRLVANSPGLDGAKCKVENLTVARLPHEMDWEYVEVAMTGFRVMFPCPVNLTDCDGRRYEVRSRLHGVDGNTFDVSAGIFALFLFGQPFIISAEDL